MLECLGKAVKLSREQVLSSSSCLGGNVCVKSQQASLEQSCTIHVNVQTYSTLPKLRFKSTGPITGPEALRLHTDVWILC